MRSTGFLTKTILLICFIKFCDAQNLVPNASFETVNSCPISVGQMQLALPWDTLGASPDVFNICATNFISCAGVSVPHNFAGNSNAHTGNGYAGIIAKSPLPNFREYIQAPLTSPLVPGKLYKVEAWFKRASNSTFAVKPLGILISSGAITQSGTTNLGFPPQVISPAVISDTIDWTLVVDYIVASGGENYITVGNFNDDATSGILSLPSASACPFSGAYYYIDDVKVELINEQVNIAGDLLICAGTSTTLYSNSNTPTWWSVADNPGVSISNATTLTVSPTVNTTYILNGIYFSDSATVVITDPPIANLRNDTTICERDSILLDATNSNSTYLWSTGETTAMIYATQEETYTVEVDNGGCKRNDSFSLNVLTNPPISLGSDTVYCAFNYDFITLDAGIGASYIWYPTLEASRKIVVRSPATYTVTVEYQNGCSKDTFITIHEVCPPKFFIPSSFTPNEDGLNDQLCPLGNSYTNFEFSVFNRWGQIVFRSESVIECWDGTINGKKVSPGVYAYLLTYTSKDESETEGKSSLSGLISIIR